MVETIFESARYLKDMTRKERYEWNYEDMSPMDRLEMLIGVVEKGLYVDRSEKPNIETDLLTLELLQEDAKNIIDRSWWVAYAAGLLVPTVLGILTAINTSAATGVGVGLCTAIPSFLVGVSLVKIITNDFIFVPQANKFVDSKVKFK